MAIRPDLLAVVHAPQKPPPEKQQVGKPRTGWQAEFYRNSFVNLAGSDLNLDRQRRPEGTQKEGKAVFNEHLRAQYQSFLQNYVGRLVEVTRADKALVLGETDRRLVSLLTKAVERPDASTTPLDPINSPTNIGEAEVDVKRIEDFLNGENPENWTLANLALEQRLMDLQSAVGIKISETPRGDRSVWVNDRVIHIGIDQGVLNRAWHRAAEWGGVPLSTTGERPDDPRINPLIANINRAQVIAGTAALSVAGALPGFLAGPAVAVAGALLAPTAVGLFHASRGGVTVDVERLGATFQSLQRNPNRFRLMAAMTGIDLSRYEVTPGPVAIMQLRAGEQHRNTKAANQVLEDALTLMYTRQEFLTTVGVPYERLDAAPEQFLYSANNTPGFRLALEQTGLKVNDEIFTRFEALGGVVAGDIPASLDHWRTAREQVMAHRLTEKISAAERENQRQGTISNLEAAKNNITKTKKTREEEIGARKTALTEDRTGLTGQRAIIDKYRNRVVTNRESTEREAIVLEAQRQQAMNRVRQAGGGGAFADENAALAQINEVLENPIAATSIVIDGRPITSIVARAAAAENALSQPDPPQGALDARVYQTLLTREQSRRERAFSLATNRIAADTQLLTELRKTLVDAINRQQTPVENFGGGEPQVVEATHLINRLTEDFNAVSGWEAMLIAAGNPGVGLTEVNLRTESVYQLMTRINDAHRANNAIGWPAEQNNNIEFHARILNAIVEARARGISNRVQNPGAHFQRLTNTQTGWEIAEHQLLTLTSEQIEQLLTVRRTANPVRFAGAMLTRRQIEGAKDAARQRLEARQQALEQTERELSTWIAREDQTLAGLDRTENETRYDLALRLMRGETNKDGKVTVSGRERIARESVIIQNDPDTFFSTTQIDQNDRLNLIEAERENMPVPAGPTPYPQGYLRLMDKIFSYRTGTTEEQNKQFRAAVLLVPPSVLARIFDDTIVARMAPLVGPPLPPQQREDINAVLADVRGYVGAGRATANDVQEVFEEVVRRVAAETQLRGVTI